MSSRLHDSGFSLVEILLALGLLAALAITAFVLYPSLMTRVHADADKRAIAAGYMNLVQVMRSGGMGRFNRDPNSHDGPLSDNPAALAALLKPIDCSGDWGYLDCHFDSASSGYVDFMSAATCQDPSCGSVGAPYNVFSMRVSLYDVSVESCIALLSGMGIQQTDTGASAVYIIGSTWAYKPLFLNTATIPNIVAACQDPSGTNSTLMFDFWPWGEPKHMYPVWGG